MVSHVAYLFYNRLDFDVSLYLIFQKDLNIYNNNIGFLKSGNGLNK